MRIIFWAILVISLLNNSCQDKCRCDFDKAIILNNDSVVNLFDSLDISKKFLMNKLTSDNYNSYRLSIIPSYDCEKRIYSLINKQNSTIIKVNYFNKFDGNSFSDTLSRSESYKLTEKQFYDFEKIIYDNCFWTMKSEGEVTLDGVGWMLEGHKTKNDICSNRKYHLVWRKNNDSIFFSICDELLKLANTSYSEQDQINYKCWIK